MLPTLIRYSRRGFLPTSLSSFISGKTCCTPRHGRDGHRDIAADGHRETPRSERGGQIGFGHRDGTQTPKNDPGGRVFFVVATIPVL